MKGFGTESKRGFTLVEVMVGLGIFALTATAVFLALGQGYVMMNKTRDLTRVTQIIQYQTENLRGSSFDYIESLAAGTFTTKYLTVDAEGIPNGEGTQQTPPFNFHSFQLRQFILKRHDDLYQVYVVADWKDSEGKSYQDYNLTYFTRNGLNEFYLGIDDPDPNPS